jgi:tetratricopeptide (TPR) repeat protein
LLKPFEAETLNNFAWILATCPKKEFRNSQTALQDAKKACELTKNMDWNCLDTLGAAYAQNQKFKAAIAAAEKAVQLAPSDKQDAIRNRIALYKDKKPFREK